MKLRFLAAASVSLVTSVTPAARAESCADILTFVTPAKDLDGSADPDDLATAIPVPIDVRPRVVLAHDCGGQPAEVELTVRDVTTDAVLPGTVVEETGALDWAAYELALDAPLAPSTQYELCFTRDGGAPECVAFATTDAVTPALVEPPTLTLHDVLDLDTDSGEYFEIDVEVATPAFPGVVWVEIRGSGLAPGVIVADASTGEGDRGEVLARIDGDELCAVAVARSASGARLESEPSCREIGGSCTIAGPPGGAPGGIAVGVALAACALVARRRHLA